MESGMDFVYKPVIQPTEYFLRAAGQDELY